MASNADDVCRPNMSSYAASFNPPEDPSEFTTVISQSPIHCDDSSIYASSSVSDKRPAATVTPSRRKKAKSLLIRPRNCRIWAVCTVLC